MILNKYSGSCEFDEKSPINLDQVLQIEKMNCW